MSKTYFILCKDSDTFNEVNALLKQGGIDSNSCPAFGCIVRISGKQNNGFNNFKTLLAYEMEYNPDTATILFAEWFLKNPELISYWKKPKLTISKVCALLIVANHYGKSIDDVEIVDA